MENQVDKQGIEDIEVDEVSLIALILAYFLPPLGVLIKDGLKCSFFINCVLTILGFIPGIIHALYVILKK